MEICMSRPWMHWSIFTPSCPRAGSLSWMITAAWKLAGRRLPIFGPNKASPPPCLRLIGPKPIGERFNRAFVSFSPRDLTLSLAAGCGIIRGRESSQQLCRRTSDHGTSVKGAGHHRVCTYNAIGTESHAGHDDSVAAYKAAITDLNRFARYCS